MLHKIRKLCIMAIRITTTVCVRLGLATIDSVSWDKRGWSRAKETCSEDKKESILLTPYMSKSSLAQIHSLSLHAWSLNNQHWLFDIWITQCGWGIYSQT